MDSPAAIIALGGVWKDLYNRLQIAIDSQTNCENLLRQANEEILALTEKNNSLQVGEHEIKPLVYSLRNKHSAQIEFRDSLMTFNVTQSNHLEAKHIIESVWSLLFVYFT